MTAGSPTRGRRAPIVAGSSDDARQDQVQYDDVTLFDGPNESYAAIVGRMHAGDEVLVTRLEGEWAEVRSPAGVPGWVPSMTLTMAPAQSDSDAPPVQAAPAASKGAARRTSRPSRARARPKPGGAPS